MIIIVISGSLFAFGLRSAEDKEPFLPIVGVFLPFYIIKGLLTWRADW